MATTGELLIDTEAAIQAILTGAQSYTRSDGTSTRTLARAELGTLVKLRDSLKKEANNTSRGSFRVGRPNFTNDS